MVIHLHVYLSDLSDSLEDRDKWNYWEVFSLQQVVIEPALQKLLLITTSLSFHQKTTKILMM